MPEGQHLTSVQRLALQDNLRVRPQKLCTAQQGEYQHATSNAQDRLPQPPIPKPMHHMRRSKLITKSAWSSQGQKPSGNCRRECVQTKRKLSLVATLQTACAAAFNAGIMQARQLEASTGHPQASAAGGYFIPPVARAAVSAHSVSTR